MFYGCSNLSSIDVSELNVNFFRKFVNENQLNIKKW